MKETLELKNPTQATAHMIVAPVVDVDVNKLDTAKPLTEIFQPYQTTLEKWEAKAASLVVTDISQKAEMQMARVARLELREARCEMEKTRKNLVQGLKERTSKIDTVARTVREKIEELEETLRASEEFAERYAAKVKAELKAKREAELIPLLDTQLIGDLSDLSEADYTKTLENAKLARQARTDAINKHQAELKAKEEAARLEHERIATENARLKLERVEIAAKFKAELEETARKAEIERKRVEAERAVEKAKFAAERIAAESKARQEQALLKAAADESYRKAHVESERANAMLAEKAQAESDQKARVEAERVTKEKEAKRAAAAPDKTKLKAFALLIANMDVPDLVNLNLGDLIAARLKALSVWIESQIEQETLL